MNETIIETRRIGKATRQVIELGTGQALDPAEVIRMARLNKARAPFLRGRTMAGLSLSEEVSTHYDQVIAGYQDKEFLKKRSELLAASVKENPDPKVRQQMASIRVETFSNYLYAPALWLTQYAEIVNLKADERPVAERITMQEVNVYAVGGDGEPKVVKISLDPDDTLIPLGYVTTDIVRYRKVDVYRGRVTDPALATIRLSYDMGNRIDGRIQTLLLGGNKGYTSASGFQIPAFFGAFTFTGKRANWSYVANSRINTSNLPSSNDVICVDQNNAALSTFGFQVLANIVDYCARWDGAFQDGINLKPTGRILLPPGHIKQIMSGIYPSGATRNKIADELMEQGWFGVNFLGTDWLFVPDLTLDPTKKICYPEFNKKPIKAFFKPELDEEKDSDGKSYELDKKNEVERYMRRVFGSYWDSSSRAYAARFRYDGGAFGGAKLDS